MGVRLAVELYTLRDRVEEDREVPLAARMVNPSGDPVDHAAGSLATLRAA